jgi:hypothetical protein
MVYCQNYYDPNKKNFMIGKIRNKLLALQFRLSQSRILTFYIPEKHIIDIKRTFFNNHYAK